MRIMKRVLILFSGLMMVFCSFIHAGAEVSAAAFSQKQFTAEIRIVEYLESVYTPEDFTEEYVLFIFGRQVSQNTDYMISQAENLVKNGYSVKPVVMLVDDLNDPYSDEDYKDMHPDVIISDTYAPNNSLGYDMLEKAGISGYTQPLPFVFLMNKERTVIASGTGYENTGKFVNLIKGEPAGGSSGSGYTGENEQAEPVLTDTSINWTFKGTYHQEEARSIFGMINEFRTGEEAWAWDSTDTNKVKYENLKPLKYDYGLERAAMIRAKEIAMMFSHTRPDGRRCFTAYDPGYSYNGENIAAGQENAEAAFIAWREDEKPFSGQGHRRNMLGDYTAVGIACVEVNGRKYWVQEFSESLLDTKSVNYPEEEQLLKVSVLRSFCKLKMNFLDMNGYLFGAYETINAGDEIELPFAAIWLTADDFSEYWVYCERFYSSTDESAAVVKDGKIIGVGEGECDIVISADFLGMHGSVPLHLTVRGHEHDYKIDHWQWSSDYSSAKAFLVCSLDSSHTLEADAVISKEEKAASCTGEGWRKYTAAVTVDGKEFTDTKTVTLEKQEHRWGQPVYTWSADNNTVLAEAVCLSCGESVSSSAKTSYAVIKQPTKTETGTGRYTAAFSTAPFTAQTKDVVIPKLADEAPSSIRLNMTNAEIATKAGVQLTAAVSPSGANQSVIWSSSSEEIATVDQNGRVTAHRYGKAVITAVSSVNSAVAASCTVNTRYYDVNDTGLYYYKPVYWAADRNITKGYDNVYFGPENNCTREAVVTFLWRAAGRPEPKSASSKFPDVQERSKYYYKAVLWASEQGITAGYSDGTFRPDDTCLREHVVTFLWRFAGKPAPSSAKNPFNDIRSSDYYYKAALWANEKGIAKGYSSGAHAGGFGPKLDCLREHVVTFLYRYMK